MTSTALDASLVVSATSLGAGLLVIAGAERFDAARIRHSVLFRRWLTWLAIASVVLAAVAAGTLGVLALFATLAAVAAAELRCLLGTSRASATLGAAAAAALVLAAHVSAQAAVLAAIAGAAALAITDLEGPPRRLVDRVLGAGGPAAVAVALAAGPRMLANLEGGALLLVATLFAVAIGDVGAYVAGRSLGGPRLAPRVSPNKRWGGVLGNVAGALAAFAAFALLSEGRIEPAWLVLPAVVAPASVAGDLVESALKRHAGVKDSGHWLPGFGGLLDRIDSSLLALPAAYLAALLLGWQVAS